MTDGKPLRGAALSEHLRTLAAADAARRAEAEPEIARKEQRLRDAEARLAATDELNAELEAQVEDLRRQAQGEECR